MTNRPKNYWGFLNQNATLTAENLELRRQIDKKDELYQKLKVHLETCQDAYDRDLEMNMREIETTEFELAFESYLFNTLKLKIRYIHNEGKNVELYGVYLWQDELRTSPNTTNDVNIISFLTMDTCHEIEVAIFQELEGIPS